MLMKPRDTNPLTHLVRYNEVITVRVVGCLQPTPFGFRRDPPTLPPHRMSSHTLQPCNSATLYEGGVERKGTSRVLPLTRLCACWLKARATRANLYTAINRSTEEFAEPRDTSSAQLPTSSTSIHTHFLCQTALGCWRIANYLKAGRRCFRAAPTCSTASSTAKPPASCKDTTSQARSVALLKSPVHVLTTIGKLNEGGCFLLVSKNTSPNASKVSSLAPTATPTASFHIALVKWEATNPGVRRGSLAVAL